MTSQMRATMALAAMLSLLFAAGSIRGAEVYDDFDDGNLFDGDPASWGRNMCGNVGPWAGGDGEMIIAAGARGFNGTGLLTVIPGAVSVRFQVKTTVVGAVAAFVGLDLPNCGGSMWGELNYRTGQIAVGRSDGGVGTYHNPTFLDPLPFVGEELAVQLDFTGCELRLRVWRPDEEMPAEPMVVAAEKTYPSGMCGVYFMPGESAGQAEFDYIWILEAPEAAMSIEPASGTAPLDVTLDGSASFSEVDRDTVKWAWDFGDGSVAEGKKATHTYASAGEYQVRLTVSDEEGASACATEVVGVGCPREDVAPWVAADIGDPSWSGGARLEGDELHVCAAGAGFKTGGDEAFFVYQQIEGDFRITARVTDMDAGTSGQRAGVMIRDSLEPNARMATALVQAAANPEARRNRLNYRKNAGSSLGTLTLSPTVTGAEIRVRLERQGLEKVIASASSDGVTWSSVEVPFDSPLPPTLFVGIAACNGSPPATGSYATLGATLAVDLDTTPAVRFKRGDANGDGDTQISDPVFTLMYIFSDGPEPTCVKTADVNDDGSLDLGDPIYGLNYLFVSGPAPLAPFPGCGADPTEDDLSCEAYSPCQ